MSTECVVSQQGGQPGDAEILVSMLAIAAQYPSSSLVRLMQERGLSVTVNDPANNAVTRARDPPPPPAVAPTEQPEAAVEGCDRDGWTGGGDARGQDDRDAKRAKHGWGRCLQPKGWGPPTPPVTQTEVLGRYWRRHLGMRSLRELRDGGSAHARAAVPRAYEPLWAATHGPPEGGTLAWERTICGETEQ